MAWTPPEASAPSWQPPEVAAQNSQDMSNIGAWADSSQGSDQAGASQRLDEENSPQIAEQVQASGKPAVPLYRYQKNGYDTYSKNPSSGGTIPGGPNNSPIEHTPLGGDDEIATNAGVPFPVRASAIDTQAVPNMLMGAYSKALEQDVGGNELTASGDYKKHLQKQAKALQEQNTALTKDPQTNFGREALPFAEQIAFPGSLPGMMLGGAVTSALNPTTSDDQSQALSAGKGAAFSAGGYGLGKLLGKAIQPIANELSGAQQAALDRLKARGLDSDLAQETGNPTVAALKQSSTDKGIVGSLTEKQNNWFTQQAAGEAGINKPTNLSRSDMEDQFDALGTAHKDIYTTNPVTTNVFNGQLVSGPVALGLRAGGAKDDLTRGIEAAFKDASERGLPSGDSTTTIPGVLKLIQKFTNTKTGVINPKTLASARSALGSIQAEGTGGEQLLASQVADMLDHHTMDQAFQRGGDASALPTINKQLQNLYSLKKATQNDSRPLTPANWLATMKARDSGDSAYQLANDGTIVMANNKPNRIWSGLLGHVGVPATIGAAYGAMHGDWKEAAKYGLIAGVAPAAAGLAIRNKVGKGLFSGWANSNLAAGAKAAAPLVGASFAGDMGQNQSPLLQNGNQ